MPDPRFKIVSSGPGDADVVHRATNKLLGYLRADYWMQWEAYCINEPGMPLGKARLRALAAARVWEHRQETHA